jgi:hypothetical protein
MRDQKTKPGITIPGSNPGGASIVLRVHSGVMANRSAAHRGREPDGGAYLPMHRISRKTYTVGWRFRSHGKAGWAIVKRADQRANWTRPARRPGIIPVRMRQVYVSSGVADCHYWGERVAVDRLLAHIAKDHPRPAAGDLSPKLVRKPIR